MSEIGTAFAKAQHEQVLSSRVGEILPRDPSTEATNRGVRAASGPPPLARSRTGSSPVQDPQHLSSARAAGPSEMRLQPPIEVKMTKMGLDTKPSELRPLKSATSRENGIEIASEWAAQETPSRVGRSDGILFDRIISGPDPSITSSPKANAHAKAPSRSIDPKAVVAAQPDNGHPRIKYAPPLDARSATQVGTASSQPARQPQTKHQGQPAKVTCANPQRGGAAHAGGSAAAISGLSARQPTNLRRDEGSRKANGR